MITEQKPTNLPNVLLKVTDFILTQGMEEAALSIDCRRPMSEDLSDYLNMGISKSTSLGEIGEMIINARRKAEAAKACDRESLDADRALGTIGAILDNDGLDYKEVVYHIMIRNNADDLKDLKINDFVLYRSTLTK